MVYFILLLHFQSTGERTTIKIVRWGYHLVRVRIENHLIVRRCLLRVVHGFGILDDLLQCLNAKFRCKEAILGVLKFRLEGCDFSVGQHRDVRLSRKSVGLHAALQCAKCSSDVGGEPISHLG